MSEPITFTWDAHWIRKVKRITVFQPITRRSKPKYNNVGCYINIHVTMFFWHCVYRLRSLSILNIMSTIVHSWDNYQFSPIILFVMMEKVWGEGLDSKRLEWFCSKRGFHSLVHKTSVRIRIRIWRHAWPYPSREHVSLHFSPSTRSPAAVPLSPHLSPF